MNFKQKKTKKKWLPIAIVVITIASTFMWSDFLVSKINNILLPIRLKTYKTTVGIQNSINSVLNINTISEKNKELELTLAKQKYISVDNKNLLNISFTK